MARTALQRIQAAGRRMKKQAEKEKAKGSLTKKLGGRTPTPTEKRTGKSSER